ncbi:hypothetical protein GCM10018962_07280 [Dactylosporangium matsuzakiense]|uniref:Uncharacterized protein n=1 Tax=Dactylosporangium matsuzakiense TaxID=53360 RepID=A0A9W6KAW5_9ACTN|nr:hypothetical protein GCM10017581_004810 [Dactylosporangium matsuzakiense]
MPRAGIVDHGVEPAVVGDDRTETVGDLLRIGDVEPPHLDAIDDSGRLRGLDKPCGAGGVPHRGHAAPPGPSRRDRDSQTDAGRSTGNEDNWLAGHASPPRKVWVCGRRSLPVSLPTTAPFGVAHASARLKCRPVRIPVRPIGLIPTREGGIQSRRSTRRAQKIHNGRSLVPPGKVRDLSGSDIAYAVHIRRVFPRTRRTSTDSWPVIKPAEGGDTPES